MWDKREAKSESAPGQLSPAATTKASRPRWTEATWDVVTIIGSAHLRVTFIRMYQITAHTCVRPHYIYLVGVGLLYYFSKKGPKSRPKNLSNLINQFHEFFLGQIPFFAISKMAKNQFLKWEKV